MAKGVEPPGNMVPPTDAVVADQPRVQGGLSHPTEYVMMPDGELVPRDWLREVWWAEAELERLCAADDRTAA